MSFKADANDLLADARALKDRMSAACEEVGRNPETLRPSFLLFDADSRASGGRNFYWDHVGAFEHVASTLFAMGYDEIGVYYPVDAQRDVCEAVAATVMPGLRDC